MSDNSSNDELQRPEMTRAVCNDYFNPTAANYQHLLPPQYFTQQMYYPYVNPYSHLTETNGNLAIHGYGSDGRPKFRRSRTIFNPEQLDVLEHHFGKYKYPDIKRRKIISEEIGLPEERVQIWFQNRRAKGKRQTDQQAKLQKLVDEAIGTQEGNRIRRSVECGTSISFHNPVEQLNKLSQYDVEAQAQLEACNSTQRHNTGAAYTESKETIFSESYKPAVKTSEGTSPWQSGSEESGHESQVAIQNIDQELLFKVANILSASNDAAQLISDWSHSPNKIQTNSLEEQLRHFAEHHQKVLKEPNVPSDNLNVSKSGLDKPQYLK